MVDPLEAVSPLDGRYSTKLAPLREYLSEAALHRARLRIEVEYLLAIAEEDVPVDIPTETATALRSCYREFDTDDARAIARIEFEGDDDRPATNHDVKAVEYWLRDWLDDRGLGEVVPFVHIGLTSEDVNNLSYRVLLRAACEEELLPTIKEIRHTLATAAESHRSVPMLARTHGQAASPTTYGKELAVYASRLDGRIDDIESAVAALEGKFAGATGTLAAHQVAMPEVEWLPFAEKFVESLGLTYRPLTTQVNPNDDLARLLDAIARTNTVLIDLDRDMWRYVSDGYLVQATDGGEVGSSTMPHKVNPIDFENSEGNLANARSRLRFLADYLPESRLQRDLSDSTVSRTIGTALGHSYLGYKKTITGLGKVEPDEARMVTDLEEEYAVLGEAVQTALRRTGDREAYERVKAASRGVAVGQGTFDELIDALRETDPSIADRLDSLTPATYTGLAAALVDQL